MLAAALTQMINRDFSEKSEDKINLFSEDNQTHEEVKQEETFEGAKKAGNMQQYVSAAALPAS